MNEPAQIIDYIASEQLMYWLSYWLGTDYTPRAVGIDNNLPI